MKCFGFENVMDLSDCNLNMCLIIATLVSVLVINQPTQSVELRTRVLEIRSLVPSRVKPRNYKIDTCQFLAWRSALLAEGKDRLAQCVEINYTFAMIVHCHNWYLS